MHDVEAQKRNISSDPTCKNVHFNPWRVHGGYMAGTWRVHGGYMAGIWWVHGGYMVGTWRVGGG